MSAVTSAGLGAVGSLLGASQSSRAASRRAEEARKASRKAAAELRGLAGPYMEQAEYAMPRFRSLIESQYATQVGEDNPLLAAEHEQNLSNISKQQNSALADSKRYWGSMGDLSRSRGEALRIGRDATDEMNRENLGYGTQQQSYRSSTADRLANALSVLNSMASPGLKLMEGASEMEASGGLNAANIRAKGDQEFWDALGVAARKLGAKR